MMRWNYERALGALCVLLVNMSNLGVTVMLMPVETRLASREPVSEVWLFSILQTLLKFLVHRCYRLSQNWSPFIVDVIRLRGSDIRQVSNDVYYLHEAFLVLTLPDLVFGNPSRLEFGHCAFDSVFALEFVSFGLSLSPDSCFIDLQTSASMSTIRVHTCNDQDTMIQSHPKRLIFSNLGRGFNCLCGPIHNVGIPTLRPANHIF